MFIFMYTYTEIMPRHKNLNNPAAKKIVRIRDKGYKILREENKKHPGELLPDTLNRILLQHEELIKKVKALQVENVGLFEELSQVKLSNERLINIQKKQAQEIAKIEDFLPKLEGIVTWRSVIK